jgi:hypothetical protein
VRAKVDFVAVLAERPDEARLAGLASAHQDVREAFPLPRFEGVHVMHGDLSQPPDACPDVPYVFQGSFQPAGRFSLNPEPWHELAWHGIAVHLSR